MYDEGILHKGEKWQFTYGYGRHSLLLRKMPPGRFYLHGHGRSRPEVGAAADTAIHLVALSPADNNTTIIATI